MILPLCPLCEGSSIPFFEQQYFRCNHCNGVFLDSSYFVSASEEKARYEEHLNDVNDENYQHFVSPITDQVIDKYPKTAAGLDFGSGNAPVITHVLNRNGFRVAQYDIFYAPDTSVLDHGYDFIAACEVVEHFHQPKKEFTLLRSLLKPGGSLFIMTNMITKPERFENWYYRRDPTHVFFYTPETFEYIRTTYGFNELIINNRLITLAVN